MLRKVKVEAAVYTVSSGTVGLSAAQAKSRLHNLVPVKGKVDPKTGAGEYEVKSPIQFKSGEEFGFSGKVGKAGELHDPEAVELAKMEQAENAEQAIKAAVAAERERGRVVLEEAVARAVAETEARVRAELAPKPQ